VGEDESEIGRQKVMPYRYYRKGAYSLECHLNLRVLLDRRQPKTSIQRLERLQDRTYGPVRSRPV
jgi:hypothetical protein